MKSAKQVLHRPLANLDQSMELAGIKHVKGCNQTILRKIQYEELVLFIRCLRSYTLSLML